MLYLSWIYACFLFNDTNVLFCHLLNNYLDCAVVQSMDYNLICFYLLTKL